MNRDFSRFNDALDRHWHISDIRNPLIHAACLEQSSVTIAALGARLSHESWGKSSPEADRALLGRLERMGDEHAKCLRGLQYTLLIEAPRYWWAEMDTYTVGVISLGSTSTMHKDAKRLKGDELVQAKSAITEGTLQMRLKVFSYPALRRIIRQRKDHRLPEWQAFCGWAHGLLESEGIK
jgi:hypothetical protein